MIGTLVNVAAVLAGSTIGLLVHARLSERITAIAFQAIGLFTLYLGFSMAAETGNFLILIFSVVIGSILGELLRLEERIEHVGNALKARIRSRDQRFTEGMVTAFLLFCMGSMTVLGAFEEGLGGKPDLLLAKSMLDGFSSIALASSMGIGVLFSIIPLLLYQGGLTLFAGLLKNALTEPVVAEMTASGGIVLLGMGINLLQIKKLRILNMLPALAVAALLAILFL